jgi:hypothetical protein
MMLTWKQAVCVKRLKGLGLSETTAANNSFDAAYHMILWRVWLNRCLDGSEDEFMLDWAPLRSVPQVVPRPGAFVEGKGQKKTQ